jgi:rSAM/selenodomain-associated transferase 1
MRDPVVVIMAKQPAVGRTKTRLCPPLTPAEAVALYEAMLRDTIRLVADLEGVRLAIAVTPPEATGAFRRISPPHAILLPVAGADIGECLNQALGRLLAAGHSRAIALNSDGPTLPAAFLKQAITRLDGADVVLGPSEDGGYYLIGLTQPQPELFQDIEWSTEQVTAQTLARAEAMGLSVALLPPWYDVDTAADLDRLQAELATLPAEALPHTRRLFAHRLQESPPGCSNGSARIKAARTEVGRRLTSLPTMPGSTWSKGRRRPKT